MHQTNTNTDKYVLPFIFWITEDNPSCAVIDKQHVQPCFPQTFLGHVCIVAVVPPTQPTVWPVWVCFGWTLTAGDEPGAPFMNVS